MILVSTNLDFFFNSTESLIKNEYLPILIYLIIAVIISVIIIAFSFLLVVQNPETEKMSAYECGFEPYEDARHKFNIKFYLIAMLFIIFDLETMFLLPWSISISKINLLGFWSMIDFLIELFFGFVYVFYIGALNWD